MIVVIADDLTGAAELAGIGLRHGLAVEMSTVVTGSDADLLVIATDTRSMTETEAVNESGIITNEVLALQPGLVYKKIDSVLRGHVIRELMCQLQVLGRERALVVAASPSLERTIHSGVYYYKGQPIHESSFANDPEFAITTSDVLQMLRTTGTNVKVAKRGEDIHSAGIYVGEVSNDGDVAYWAGRVDESILSAGGADFFSALLDQLGYQKVEETVFSKSEAAAPVLYVSGTTFDKSRDAIKKIKFEEGPVSYMPEAVITAKEFEPEVFQLWSNEITAFIHSTGKAIIAIDAEKIKNTGISAKMLREKMAVVVNDVLKQVDVGEVFIEGGATAAAILNVAGFKSFIPTAELARGVVTMQVKEKEGLFVTVKPGSYLWPGEVWRFEELQ